MKQSFVDIDVSKNSLDVHVLPGDVSSSFAYEPQKVKLIITTGEQATHDRSRFCSSVVSSQFEYVSTTQD